MGEAVLYVMTDDAPGLFACRGVLRARP